MSLIKTGQFINLLFVFNGNEDEANTRASVMLTHLSNAHEVIAPPDRNWDDLDMMAFALAFLSANVDAVNENLKEQLAGLPVEERMRKPENKEKGND